MSALSVPCSRAFASVFPSLNPRSNWSTSGHRLPEVAAGLVDARHGEEVGDLGQGLVCSAWTAAPR